MNALTTRRSERILSVLIVLLGIPAHLVGLLRPAIYRDPAILVPQNLGSDVITLGVGLPLLAVTTLLLPRGTARVRILWLGALGFLVYDYGMYAMGVRWNELFLLYTALFGLSLFGLIIGLVATDATAVRASLAPGAPRRSVAAYLLVIPVIVALLWLSEEVPATLAGTVPRSVTQFETPTDIVHVFDLAVVLPAMVIAAVMLLRDRAWGYVLGGMLVFKAATIGLWVAAMIWFSARQGFPTPPAQTVFFVLLAALGGGLTWWFTAGRTTPALGDAGHT